MTTWREEVRSGIVEQLSKIVVIGLVLIVGISVLSAKSWFNSQEGSQENKVVDLIHLPPDYPRTSKSLPDFDLVDQQGNRVTPATLTGHPTVVTFAFSHCAAVCPTLIHTVKAAIEQAGADTNHALIISLDPERDTPATLPALVKNWELGAGFSVVSGDPSKVARVLKDFAVPLSRDATTGEIVHPALVYVVGADGKIAYTFNNPSQAWLVQALARVAG
jgi:protein SCO1